jgi:hypothetical protein
MIARTEVTNNKVSIVKLARETRGCSVSSWVISVVGYDKSTGTLASPFPPPIIMIRKDSSWFGFHFCFAGFGNNTLKAPP